MLLKSTPLAEMTFFCDFPEFIFIRGQKTEWWKYIVYKKVEKSHLFLVALFGDVTVVYS